MRKPTLKRLVLGLIQQTAALFLMVAIAAVLFNSYLAVDTADGTKVYDCPRWIRRLNLRIP